MFAGKCAAIVEGADPLSNYMMKENDATVVRRTTLQIYRAIMAAMRYLGFGELPFCYLSMYQCLCDKEKIFAGGKPPAHLSLGRVLRAMSSVRLRGML